MTGRAGGFFRTGGDRTSADAGAVPGGDLPQGRVAPRSLARSRRSPLRIYMRGLLRKRTSRTGLKASAGQERPKSSRDAKKWPARRNRSGPEPFGVAGVLLDFDVVARVDFD